MNGIWRETLRAEGVSAAEIDSFADAFQQGRQFNEERGFPGIPQTMRLSAAFIRLTRASL